MLVAGLANKTCMPSARGLIETTAVIATKVRKGHPILVLLIQPKPRQEQPSFKHLLLGVKNNLPRHFSDDQGKNTLPHSGPNQDTAARAAKPSSVENSEHV